MKATASFQDFCESPGVSQELCKTLGFSQGYHEIPRFSQGFSKSCRFSNRFSQTLRFLQFSKDFCKNPDFSKKGFCQSPRLFTSGFFFVKSLRFSQDFWQSFCENPSAKTMTTHWSVLPNKNHGEDHLPNLLRSFATKSY